MCIRDSGYVVDTWKVRWNELHQQLLGAEKNPKTGDSPQQEEQQALGQELADETRSGGSKSLAHRDLASSTAGTGKQKVGDVNAADQKLSLIHI